VEETLDVDGMVSGLTDARDRTIALVADLTEAQLLGPAVPFVWPPKWEAGHAAWFAANRVVELALGEPSPLPYGRSLFDSIAVARDARWNLPLPTKDETLAFLRTAHDLVTARLRSTGANARLRHFARFALLHEDMHTETMVYARQTLEYPEPRLSRSTPAAPAGPAPGDARIPGGTYLLGAPRGASFAFDNEQWAHPVEIRPFAIARAPVTQAEFAAFVDSGGYHRQELWSVRGWRWRVATDAAQPRYWRRVGAGWERRDFERWRPLEPHLPVAQVNWYEAEAYCVWAHRRLPTEAEWEVAALGEPAAGGRLAPQRRRHPWGDAPSGPDRANAAWQAPGCVDVGALPAGDSAFGCRQMLGNVWEWTSSTFLPYPGFEADGVYPEYSEPWVHTRKVLRGGSWTPPARLLRATFRNFYPPDRGNNWAGFRTCAW
jgi:gamma-glutamyl hercynylcysteine S-oxide synthase